MLDLLETAELVAFTRTVEAGSLSRAAKELGIPRATLGRRLARLEERLGVRLIRRTTRSIRVTPAGEALLLHARVALGAVRDAVTAARQEDGLIRGLVRFASLPLGRVSHDALICAFVEAHPGVQLHVDVSARFVRFSEADYDVALRAGDTVEQGLVSRRLTRMAMVAIASPGYLARYGTPTRVEDLPAHRCLLGFLRGTAPNHYWPLRGGGSARVEGVLVSNDVHLLREAVARGLGIAMLPMIIAEALLLTGEAVPVLEGILEGESQIAVVYPEKAFLSPVVRAFIDVLVQWAKVELVPKMRPAPPRTPPAKQPALPKKPRASKKKK